MASNEYLLEIFMFSSLKALLFQHMNNVPLGCDRDALLLVSDGDSSTDADSLETF